VRACGWRAEEEADAQHRAHGSQEQAQLDMDGAMVTPASREGHKAGARTPARSDMRWEVHGLDAVPTPPVRSHHDVSFNLGPHDRPCRPVGDTRNVGPLSQTRRFMTIPSCSCHRTITRTPPMATPRGLMTQGKTCLSGWLRRHLTSCAVPWSLRTHGTRGKHMAE